MDILMMVLVAAFICVGIALVVLLLQLVKFLRSTQESLDEMTTKVNPMLDNVGEMIEDLRPTVKKMDPLVDRVQLTLDAVNLEMMRVDEILEDVAQITDTASSATVAIDHIANAPAKAVNNVATRVRKSLGPKPASEESIELAEKRDSVARALADFKATQAGDADEESGEPNLEGFEKIVVDSEQPAVDADGVFGEPEAQPQAAPKADAAALAD